MQIPKDVRELHRNLRDGNDSLEVTVWNRGGLYHVAWTRANGCVAEEHPDIPTFDDLEAAFAHGFRMAKSAAKRGGE